MNLPSFLCHKSLTVSQVSTCNTYNQFFFMKTWQKKKLKWCIQQGIEHNKQPKIVKALNKYFSLLSVHRVMRKITYKRRKSISHAIGKCSQTERKERAKGSEVSKGSSLPRTIAHRQLSTRSTSLKFGTPTTSLTNFRHQWLRFLAVCSAQKHNGMTKSCHNKWLHVMLSATEQIAYF